MRGGSRQLALACGLAAAAAAWWAVMRPATPAPAPRARAAAAAPAFAAVAAPGAAALPGPSRPAAAEPAPPLPPDAGPQPAAALPETAGWLERSGAADAAVFGAFARWAAAAAAGEAVPAGGAGADLARARRAAMKALIETDPRQALRLAVPYEVRRALPADVVALLERPVDAAAAYEVAVACGLGKEGARDATERTALIGGERLVVHAYGRRLDVTTKYGLPVHGVALDGLLAMHESPVRVLGPAERADRAAGAGGVALDVGSGVVVVAGEAGREQLERRLIEAEHRLGPRMTPPVPAADVPAGGGGEAEPPAAESPWTEGAKTMLYIRARFTNDDPASEPLSLADAQAHQAKVDTFWRNASYGRTSLASTFTGVVDLPQPSTAYSGSFAAVLSAARAAALGANPAWNAADYDLYVVVTSDKDDAFTYAGSAYVGAAGAHLVVPYYTLRTAGHEYGHNLGLRHANYWRTDSESPIGRDRVPGGYVADTNNAEWVEYGHYFSLMGAQFDARMNDPAKPHYAAFEKKRLDWLGGADLVETSTGGVYRLYRLDHPSTSGAPKGLRIARAASDYTGNAREYWLQYRPAFGDAWSTNGLQVDWAKTTYGTDGATQLDMTPFSRDDASGGSWSDDNTDKEDGFLVVGRTYSDEEAGIHVTPTARGGTEPEQYLDVVIRLGASPGNAPPTVAVSASTLDAAAGEEVLFEAFASDPDGDALAWWWDFNTNTLDTAALNTGQVRRSWSAPGVYRVRCVASDMKGGAASDSVVVRVGDPPARHTVRGRVLRGGLPVADARVYTASGAQARTDSDGTYALVDLAAGSHVLACDRRGLTFAARFANPVAVAGGEDVFGCDFDANEPPAGGGTGRAVSGRVTDAGAGLAGVEVRGGGKRASTGADGYFVLDGFADGTFTARVSRAGYTFAPEERVFVVEGEDRAGVDFARRYVTVSGLVYASSRWLAPTVSDGHHEARLWSYSNSAKAYPYTLSVPEGTWNLSVFVGDAEWSFAPSNFTNPLTVAGNLEEVHFAGQPVAGCYARGDIADAHGRPVPGVAVSAGAGSALTDTLGRYHLAGLPPGDTTLTPHLAGWSFTPSGRTVTLAANTGGLDFAAAGPDAAPTITVPAAASPASLAGPGETSLLTVAADDDGGASNLVYRWAAVESPWPVSFSPNDAPEAAAAVAAFGGPGHYVLEVLAEDAGGQRAASTTTVSVVAAGLPLTVSPFEVAVPAGGAVSFEARAWDAAGMPSTVTPAWSVSGGGVMTGGVFSAAGPAGTYRVSAVYGGCTGTASVAVQGSLPDFDGDGLPDVLDPDDDNDGLPDAWEDANGTDPFDATDATGDPDGDGFTAEQEYLAGTAEHDAASYFRLDGAASGTARSVTFSTATGRLYAVEWSADLPAANGWGVLTNGVPGTGAPVTVEDPAAPPPLRRHYRVGVRWP